MHTVPTSTSKVAEHTSPSLVLSLSLPLINNLAKLRLLISAINSLRIRQTILGIELDSYRVIVLAAVQTTTLDACNIRHDLQFRVKRASTVGTELSQNKLGLHKGTESRDYVPNAC